MSTRPQGHERARRADVRTLTLRKPLDRALRSGHPWVYRDALEPHELPAGTFVRIASRKGHVLGCGLTDGGAIGARVWTTRDEPVDAALLSARLDDALALRDRMLPADTDCLRLVHGEGDRMPGVVVDRYGAAAVLRLDGEGVLALRDALIDALRPKLQARGVHTLLERVAYERGKAREGAKVRVVYGELSQQPTQVREHGMALAVDLEHGQKTGLFLDQREARLRVRSLARGSRVLNCYGYTGGFSVAAALGGAAEVTTVDVAAPALALARRSFELNALRTPHHTLARDVPELLAELDAARARFELVIADPPNFAPSEAAVPAALASYANLHALAMARVEPGGLYLAGSCSSHVDAAAFAETLRAGAQRARRIVQVLEQHGAPADHPRLLAFPEGDYLKVVLARVW